MSVYKWWVFFSTSVCRMAARCSLAVRDSLSTSICCLQSEFWLLRVSSFVCRANSSDSFFDNSCFSWSICRCVKQTTSTTNYINTITHVITASLYLWHRKWLRKLFFSMELLSTLFSSMRFSLIKNAFGTDSPAFIIYYTSSLFMIDEKRSKNRITKLWLVCTWSTNMRMLWVWVKVIQRSGQIFAPERCTPWHNYWFQVGVLASGKCSHNCWHAAAKNRSYNIVMESRQIETLGGLKIKARLTKFDFTDWYDIVWK